MWRSRAKPQTHHHRGQLATQGDRHVGVDQHEAARARPRGTSSVPRLHGLVSGRGRTDGCRQGSPCWSCTAAPARRTSIWSRRRNWPLGRRVIFYDQIGCGRSDHPAGAMHVPAFVEEIDALREQLGLGAVHVLGQSWGGMLAMEYALTHPAGSGLDVADSPASMTLWVTRPTVCAPPFPPMFSKRSARTKLPARRRTPPPTAARGLLSAPRMPARDLARLRESRFPIDAEDGSSTTS